jgi:hypothetical protein
MHSLVLLSSPGSALAERYPKTLADFPNDRSNKIKAVHRSRAIVDAQSFQGVTLCIHEPSWLGEAK